jgi:hypothetical protein
VPIVLDLIKMPSPLKRPATAESVMPTVPTPPEAQLVVLFNLLREQYAVATDTDRRELLHSLMNWVSDLIEAMH